MRAVIIRRFGDPSVLEIGEREKPVPGPGELLVRVIASGTNPVEAKIRASGAWAEIPLPAVIGYDAAGVVEELGAGVSDFAVGDPVYYTPQIFRNALGTHAEYNVVRADIVALKPTTLDFVEAAAVPLAGGTAFEAVVRRLDVGVGDSVLIHGGAGGVGSFAVQIAKAAGARVLATAGSANQALLRELGADVAIDYTKQDPAEVARAETSGRGVDAVFDTAGGELAGKSVAALRAFGRLAVILPPGGDLSGLYLRNITLYGVFLTRESARLRELARLIEQGRVRPLIDAVLPLEDARKAHERLHSGHGRGKVVLRVQD